MNVTLRYFARLREEVDCESEQLALPDSISSVADLLSMLRARGGQWAVALAAERVFRVAVNQAIAPVATKLADGDEVAFFPPVTGG